MSVNGPITSPFISVRQVADVLVEAGFARSAVTRMLARLQCDVTKARICVAEGTRIGLMHNPGVTTKSRRFVVVTEAGADRRPRRELVDLDARRIKRFFGARVGT